MKSRPQQLILLLTVLFAFHGLRFENLPSQLSRQLKKQVLVPANQAKHPYKIFNLPEKTLEQRSIQVVSFPAKNSKKATQRVLIQAAMHGNETLTVSFVAWLMNRYASGSSLLNKMPSAGNFSFDFIPVLNPDGYFHGTRNNKREVNLNRNFSLYWGLTRENPGIAAFSEKETQALRNLFNKRDYDIAIDIHGYANWIVIPSPAPHGSSKTQERYEAMKKRLRSAKKNLPGHEFKTPMQLGDGGAFEDWAFWEKDVQAFCLEMANSERYVKMSQPGKSDYIDTFLAYERFIYDYIKSTVQETTVVKN